MRGNHVKTKYDLVRAFCAVGYGLFSYYMGIFLCSNKNSP